MAKREEYSLEFPINCSTSVLYNLLSTSDGLSEWFADKVDAVDNVFHFSWDGGAPDSAEILDEVENESIKYKWEWMGDNEYFEFRIESSAITKENILHITDFADKGEVDDQTVLWESQINELKQRMGA